MAAVRLENLVAHWEESRLAERSAAAAHESAVDAESRAHALLVKVLDRRGDAPILLGEGRVLFLDRQTRRACIVAGEPVEDLWVDGTTGAGVDEDEVLIRSALMPAPGQES